MPNHDHPFKVQQIVSRFVITEAFFLACAMVASAFLARSRSASTVGHQGLRFPTALSSAHRPVLPGREAFFYQNSREVFVDVEIFVKVSIAACASA